MWNTHGGVWKDIQLKIFVFEMVDHRISQANCTYIVKNRDLINCLAINLLIFQFVVVVDFYFV